MSVQVSAFPEEVNVHMIGKPNYDWEVCLDLGDGSRVYLKSEVADKLGADLWNRNLNQRKAA